MLKHKQKEDLMINGYGSVFQDFEPKVAEQEGLLMNPHHTDYNVIPYPKTG